MAAGAEVTAPPRPRRRRARRVLFALVAAAIVLLGLAVALELGARALWTLPPQMAEFANAGMYREVGNGAYELVPGHRGELPFALPGVPARVTHIAIDAEGCRENGASRPPGDALRVLCAGDSMVFGYGVEDGDTWPAQLQRDLAAALQRPVHAANAGVPGYGTTATAAAIVRRVPASDPAAVVFAVFLGNDVQDDCAPQVTVVGGLQFQGPMARLMRSSWRARLAARSRFWLWFETWLFTNHPALSPLRDLQEDDWATRLSGFPRDRVTGGAFLDVRDERHSWTPGGPPVVANALATMRESLQRAKGAAGTRPLVVLLQPMQFALREDAWLAELQRHGFDPAQFAFGRMRQRVGALAAELALPVVDVTDALAAAADPDALYVEDHAHFSPRGNALVAAALADRLATLLQRPR